MRPLRWVTGALKNITRIAHRMSETIIGILNTLATYITNGGPTASVTPKNHIAVASPFGKGHHDAVPVAAIDSDASLYDASWSVENRKIETMRRPLPITYGGVGLQWKKVGKS